MMSACTTPWHTSNDVDMVTLPFTPFILAGHCDAWYIWRNTALDFLDAPPPFSVASRYLWETECQANAAAKSM